jgi:hypothetical protein
MVNTGAYLKSLYNATVALGDKAVSSDATFEIEGYEHLSLLIKQFPWPELSPAGEIEVPMPMGAARWQPQQLKINQQGQITLMETQAGHIQAFLEDNISNGARFHAKVYEGTPDNYTRVCHIRDCFIQLDNPDRDFENRAQIMLVSGTLFFHYFGNQ